MIASNFFRLTSIAILVFGLKTSQMQSVKVPKWTVHYRTWGISVEPYVKRNDVQKLYDYSEFVGDLEHFEKLWKIVSKENGEAIDPYVQGEVRLILTKGTERLSVDQDWSVSDGKQLWRLNNPGKELLMREFNKYLQGPIQILKKS